MNEVKVFDGSGNLKEVISKNTLIKNHWDTFKNHSGSGSINYRARNKAEAEIAKRRKLDGA